MLKAPAHFLLILLCLSSCVKRKPPEVPDTPGRSQSESLTDDEGRTVSFDKPFARIISLYSAHTENLFALGAGSKLIGGHSTCDYPAEAAALPVFEYSGDPEYVIAAAPDLVLIRPFIRRHNPAYIDALEKAGIPVVSLYPETFGDFDGYIGRLALLAGVEAEAALAAFHSELQGVRSAASLIRERRTVFFETTERETRTAAPQSLPAVAIEISGGLNVAPDARPVSPLSSIASYGTERLLAQAEKIDAYIVQTGAMNPTKTLDALRRRAGFSGIKAVRDGNVLFIEERIVSSPIFRYLQGVKTIAHFLYPDEFKNPGPAR
ncbi:MAG: ABC transporter substrate-binding protein [Spirochaetaceae bacterium]|nr:ABC transporter substrate-binding protein [Spirochaetaceae bacterium]